MTLPFLATIELSLVVPSGGGGRRRELLASRGREEGTRVRIVDDFFDAVCDILVSYKYETS
jgi:hypothetical protein